MLAASCSKIIFKGQNQFDLAKFQNGFSFNFLVEMPEEIKELERMAGEPQLAMISPLSAVYCFLSDQLIKNTDDIITDNNLKHYFDIAGSDIGANVHIVKRPLQQNLDNLGIIFKYGQLICAVIDKYSTATARQWREKVWHSRYDAFSTEVGENYLQFKTEGSTPFLLFDQWIKENKLTCDIANVQDDFEYWSFTSYLDGEKVQHQNTLDSILSKVLTMVDGEKPTNANRFREIYRDMTGSAIPKDILKTYMNGEAAPEHC